MSQNHIDFLKEKYLGEVRPLKSADEVVRDLSKKMDIVGINELDLSEIERPHFKFLKSNYQRNIDNNISEINFAFYTAINNNKSSSYYDFMQNKKERIIIVTELKSNFIASNCDVLSLDLQIERGFDMNMIETSSNELIAYLACFDLRKQISHQPSIFSK